MSARQTAKAREAMAAKIARLRLRALAYCDGRGATSTEVGRALGVSERTARRYLIALYSEGAVDRTHHNRWRRIE